MFGLGKRTRVNEVSATELALMLEAGTAIVVDVRDPGEFAGGHIPGAVNVPLSNFAVSKLPDAGGRKVVLNCAMGGRSHTALKMCGGAGSDTHLAGGMRAWMRAGLPVAA